MKLKNMLKKIITKIKIIILIVIIINSSRAFGNSICCLNTLIDSTQLTEEDLDYCKNELKNDKENAKFIFISLITELSNSKYEGIRKYVMVSGVLPKYNFTNFSQKFYKYFSMKDILSGIIQNNFLTEELIFGQLVNIKQACIFKAIINHYDNKSNSFLERLKDYFICGLDSSEAGEIRILVAKKIVFQNGGNKAEDLTKHILENYPNELKMFIDQVYNTNDKLESISSDLKNKILEELFEQVKKFNGYQSYAIIKTIEKISNLQFINKYFRYPDNKRHFEAVRLKALKYYDRNF